MVSSASPSPADPDQDVIDLVRAGDRRKAIQRLMQRHGHAVYRYCCEAMRDDTADDVHQKVFIEAHRDLARFAGRSTLRSWLFGIARHRCLDAVKMRSRRNRHFGGEPPPQIEDREAAPPEQLDDARLRAALASCLDELDEHIRAAVLLRYQQGFSFEEMADMCDEKPGTLQARVARALPLLRQCIETRTGGKV
jgi:RNA polymerase sigma factor (sigma-70 family)